MSRRGGRGWITAHRRGDDRGRSARARATGEPDRARGRAGVGAGEHGASRAGASGREWRRRRASQRRARCARVVITATVFKTDHVAIHPFRELVDGYISGIIVRNARRFFERFLGPRDVGVRRRHTPTATTTARVRRRARACISYSVCLFRTHSWIFERYGGVGEGRDARARG